MMERERKYRAWDKFNACFYWSENYKSLSAFFDVVEHAASGDNGIVLEDYTSLKDKNGKEIYQGDVIRVQNKLSTDFHGEYSLHEVVIIHGQVVRSYLSSSSGKNLPRGYLRGFLLDEYEYDMKLFIWADESDYAPSTDIEVVGNIHENPELLTQPQN